LAGGVNHPSPLQRGGVPVMVTGVTEDDLAVVARYADACVLAGPIGHVQSMIHALGRHCAELGRDPADVTPLHTTPLVIGQSSGEIEQRLAAADQEMGAPDGQWLARAVVGRPDEVVTRLTALLDAGVQGLVVHMPGADPEAVTLAGTVLRDAFG
jgi:alkanesulfonate monooxygenase SsuD/methylene tetrahydromethanopterin reductase-like flavin-dependent oxidoreductase (luciferase family)